MKLTGIPNPPSATADEFAATIEAVYDVANRKPRRVPVSEIFGPVCQGEGMLIGKPTVFVRLGGCDYRCAWCDSMYAVDPKYRGDWTMTGLDDVADEALALFPKDAKYRHVTLSGGNPAIQPYGGELVTALHTRGIRVAIETQGSVCPSWLPLVDDITLSPKPPSSGNVTPFEWHTSALAECIRVTKAHQFATNATRCLKVVVFTEADYRYAVDVHVSYPDIPFYLQAGTIVGVSTRDDLCDSLAWWQDFTLNDPLMQDVAILPQLHAVLKGHARGI